MEYQVRDVLNRAVSHEPAPRHGVDDILRAGKRAHRRRRQARTASIAAAATFTGALALAAVTAITITTGTTPTTGDRGRSGTTTPAFDLAAAVTSTTGSSFQFTVESTLAVPADNIQGAKTTCTGAADPATNTGYIRQDSKLRSKANPTAPVIYELRVVHGHRYVGTGGHWNTDGQGSLTDLRCGDANRPALLAADPLSQLRELAQAVKVTKTADGYTFTGDGIEGTVTVSAGKVTELSYTATHAKTSSDTAYSEHVTTKLSGYGEPVPVKKPA